MKLEGCGKVDCRSPRPERESNFEELTDAGNDTGEGKSSGADAQESSVAKPPAAGAKAGSEPTVEKDGK
jgi:hypothetical protein